MLPLLLLAASAAALPAPQELSPVYRTKELVDRPDRGARQLTEEQFQARGRSLDTFEDKPVFITSSYTQVRRQGREGVQDAIKFPTLEVRNPNELSRGAVQNKLKSASPVYRQATADIEEKIRKVNSAMEAEFEAEEREQEVMEMLEVAALAVEEEEMEEAALAAEMDALTDLAAVEIVAEEMGMSSLVDMKVEEVMALIMAEEVVNEEVEAVSEAIESVVEENIVEAEAAEEEDGPAAAVDFGDITEKAV